MRKVLQFILFFIAIIAGGILLFGEIDSIVPLKVTITFGFFGFVLEIKNKSEFITITGLLLLVVWVYFYTTHAQQVTRSLDTDTTIYDPVTKKNYPRNGQGAGMVVNNSGQGSGIVIRKLSHPCAEMTTTDGITNIKNLTKDQVDSINKTNGYE